MRREVVRNDGTRISYLVFEGAQPATIILHGLAGSGREFEATARALAGRKVILIDQRGHGFSTRVPVDVPRDAFIEDVVAVIYKEPLSAVDLVGQLMGAHTAMLVAAARPDLVHRLVLLEGNEVSGSPDGQKAIGGLLPILGRSLCQPRGRLRGPRGSAARIRLGSGYGGAKASTPASTRL